MFKPQICVVLLCHLGKRVRLKHWLNSFKETDDDCVGGPSTPLAASADAAVGGRGGGDTTDGVEGPPPPGDVSAAAAAAASSHYSCPDNIPVPFLDVFPLGGLNSKMIDCSISLPDLVRTEIESVLPGILKSGRYSPNTDDDDLNSFADLALKGMVDAFEDLRSFSRLSLDQLQHLGRGKCVHEEVGDLLSNLFSRVFGAYFMNENCILCSPCLGFPWSKYLQRDPRGAKTVVLAFTFAAMLRKESPAKGNDIKKRIEIWRRKKTMDRFDTWLWNQNASRHCTTIYMRCLRSQDKSKIVVRLVDSNRKDPENASLDPYVRRLMEDTVTPLFQTCAFEDGKGVKMPQQDSFNNCLFHSILYQNSFIAGVELSTVRIHQEAAQLRCYTVLLLREERTLLPGETVPRSYLKPQSM